MIRDIPSVNAAIYPLGETEAVPLLADVSIAPVASLVPLEGNTDAVEAAEAYQPKDTEGLPLLTRVSKADADDRQSLLDLAWYIDPRSYQHLIFAEEDTPKTFASIVCSLEETTRQVQDMLRTIFDRDGLTMAQIGTINAWERLTVADFAHVYRPLPEFDPGGAVEITGGEADEIIDSPGLPTEEAAAALVPLSGIVAMRPQTFWRQRPDRIIMRQMIDALAPLGKVEWRLGFCEGCRSLFVYEHGKQIFCSQRCAVRIRARRYRERHTAK